MNTEKSSPLQKTYVQKSKLFLLPLTNIKRDKIFKPTNTYISSKDLVSSEYPTGISTNDQILIVTYSKLYKTRDQELYDKINAANFKGLIGEGIVKSAWDKYEQESLLSNPLFLSSHETTDEFIYTYDLSDWDNDWRVFVKGRFSLMSDDAKDRIASYRWTNLNKIARFQLECYLYPYKEKCLDAFARELEMPIAEMAEVKELCSKPDLNLETYKCYNLKNRKINETEGEEAI